MMSFNDYGVKLNLQFQDDTLRHCLGGKFLGLPFILTLLRHPNNVRNVRNTLSWSNLPVIRQSSEISRTKKEHSTPP
jgi:hypothetical protein